MDETTPTGNVLPDETPPAPPAEEAPPALPKPKTNVPLFILGLFTPAALWAVALALSNFLNSGVFAGIGSLAAIVLFFVLLFAFIKTAKTGDAKVRSYTKGGLFGYLVIPLFLLIAFGTCIIGGTQP